MKKLKTCSVGGCSRLHYGRGYCQMHWHRWKKTGDVGDVAPLRVMRHQESCAVEGCGEQYHAKGYCNLHYKRFADHGDPLGGLNTYRHGEESTPHTALPPVFRTGTPEQRRRFRDEVTNKINRYFEAGYASKIDAMLTDPMDWYQPAQNEAAA